MKKAIVIGATSGIGKELAKILYSYGYVVGAAGRRLELLHKLQQEICTELYIKQIDVSKTNKAISLLKDLINEMEGVDLIVISAGCGFINPDLDFEKEKETIETNVLGFAGIADTAMNYFFKQGEGHIVGISSIAAIRGSSDAPAYNASKAFVSNYLEGLRQKAQKAGLPITVTDVKPGFVDTAMAKGDGLFSS